MFKEENRPLASEVIGKGKQEHRSLASQEQ